MAEPAGLKNLATDSGGEPSLTPAQISAYYLELSLLLDRIERGGTHYQVLGIERPATLREIKQAYYRAVDFLYPPYRISATIPGDLHAKIEVAFERASRALAVLGSLPNRVRYDEHCNDSVAESSPAESTTRTRAVALREQQTANSARGDEQVDLARLPSHRRAYRAFSSGETDDDRRRVERIKLSVPVLVTGHDRVGGKWDEMATTSDVSRTGVTLLTSRRMRTGRVLYVTLPMPVKLRNHGFTDAGYSVYCIVRRVETPVNGVRRVGLEFLGAGPPPGFLEKPWGTFQTTSWKGANRRRKPREARAEILIVEYYDESMRTITKEMARTDNLSSNGAQILVKTPPAEFDVLRVVSPSQGFESFAVLRNRFRGKDGFERLCVQFTDAEWKF
ncbi:MAG TPA: PilZ domain-containing protein [Blastocatellia bacterium]|nr:PilZ domain-containing protein [Blastocatellia bacterium]